MRKVAVIIISVIIILSTVSCGKQNINGNKGQASREKANNSEAAQTTKDNANKTENTTAANENTVKETEAAKGSGENIATVEKGSSKEEYKKKYRSSVYIPTRFAEIYDENNGAEVVNLYYVTNNWIYCMGMSKEIGFSEPVKLAKTSFNEFAIVNGKLFFVNFNSGKLDALPLDGSGSITTIVDEVVSNLFSLDDKYVYYETREERDVIKKKPIKGGEEVKLFVPDGENMVTNGIFIYDKWLFCVCKLFGSSEYMLYRVNKSDGSEKMITKVNVGNEVDDIKIWKDGLYYTLKELGDSGYMHNLYKINLKDLKTTLEVKEIDNKFACNTDYSDNWIYFTDRPRSPKSLYRMKPDYTGIQSLKIDNVSWYFAGEDFLYYNDDEGRGPYLYNLKNYTAEPVPTN
ncbi:DUF5050 domain-containing protein [Desnuesiella massiliensis]|uniref:DUF5050 domain-containing protein n=1 Tax=Desnuesiella massiliensis TaxID=1650662 RepID=UPI0006E22ED5|nr:DUF5050 domain-containing protein [Desnuesiella massiliensis]